MTAVIPHSAGAHYAAYVLGADMSEAFETRTVAEIVTTDSGAASVFEHFGIDFCCGGQRSIKEACRAAGVDPQAVEQALRARPVSYAGADTDVRCWPVARLIDQIVSTHHAFTRTAIRAIARYMATLVDVHGAHHPELARIAISWDHLGRDLLQHMLKEECVLFPYVRELADASPGGWSSPFGTVENPIRMMEREHQEAGDELRQIRELTDGYTPPREACATYRICFQELAVFERDLHRHVHLENNVLFPKAVELERSRPHR